MNRKSLHCSLLPFPPGKGCLLLIQIFKIFNTGISVDITDRICFVPLNGRFLKSASYSCPSNKPKCLLGRKTWRGFGSYIIWFLTNMWLVYDYSSAHKGVSLLLLLLLLLLLSIVRYQYGGCGAPWCVIKIVSDVVYDYLHVTLRGVAAVGSHLVLCIAEIM